MPDRVSSQEERQILQKETDRLLRIIPEHSFVILLDLRGKELSSPQFSQKLEALMVQGVSHLTFVIGGPLGIPMNCGKGPIFVGPFHRLLLPIK